MVQNAHRDLAAVEGQPPAEFVAPPTTSMNRQSAQSATPRPPRPPNHKRQSCTVCRQANCRNGSLCRGDHTLSPSDSVTFPINITRGPSVDNRREGPPRRANRALSFTADPLTSPTMPQRPQRPRTTRKVSDPSAGAPTPQPRRPPSRAGAPEHPGNPNVPQHNPHGRGRRASGPPTVGPRPQQRRATSRSSAHEQDPTIRQSPPRPRIHCPEWLKGYCPEGQNCPLAHDFVARAEELRLKRDAEDLRLMRAAEELRLMRAAEELRLKRAAEELRSKRAAEELRLKRAAEELLLKKVAEELRLKKVAEELRLKKVAEELRLKRAAEELRLRKAAEERAAKAAEERAAKLAQEQAARAAQEAAATVEESVLPSTKVTYGAGVTVQRVLTGYETCRILVKNLPRTAKRTEIAAFFPQPGFDPTKFTVHQPRESNDRSHQEAVVEFEDVDDGKKAVAELDDVEFGSEKLKLVLLTSKQGGMGKSRDLNSYILTVTWPAPSDTAFASYSSLEEAESKQAQLVKETFNGRKVRVHIAKRPSNLPSEYWKPGTLSVSGLQPGVPLASIEEFCGTTSIRMATRNTRNYNLDDAVPSLQSLVAQAHSGDNQSVTYEPSIVPNEQGMVSVKITFPTWEHAKVVRDFLDQKPLPLCPQAKYFVFLPDPLHYTMHVPYLQYKAQVKLFQSLIPPKDDPSVTTHLRILVNRSDRPARIELSGSDKKTVGRLKVRIEQLTAGEKLPQWDRVFYGAEGEKVLEKVNNESGAYVRADRRQGALKAFGEPSAVEKAKAMIQEEVERLASLQFEVTLKQASVRFFMDGARGSTLLKQEVGEENVTLDVSSCKITVRGGESAHHYLNRLISESLSHAIRSQHQLKDGETCPVCGDDIDQPYRLACGHVYCYVCIRHFLRSASETKKFPLSCMGDEGECGLPIPLPVIQRLLPPAQVKRLLEVSFLDHLGRNPEKFKYCATPDCPEIYSLESDSGGGIFRCRSCFVSVCVSCKEDHDGFSCEEWKQERLLEDWAGGNKNVKKCPKCDILIEKNGGCNHMTCPKCAAHICWRCLGVFPAGDIYNHMELAHGGMLDGDEPGDIFIM